MNSHPTRRPAAAWPIDRFSPSARRRHRRVTSALALVAASQSRTHSAQSGLTARDPR